jgi:hypothetical protein
VHSYGGFKFEKTQLGQRYQGADVAQHVGSRNESDSDPVRLGALRDVESLTVIDG